jgi:hypothetical protein
MIGIILGPLVVVLMLYTEHVQILLPFLDFGGNLYFIVCMLFSLSAQSLCNRRIPTRSCPLPPLLAR